MTASGIRPQASQSYDGAGRLTSDATYSYTYDREGNLTSRTKTSSGAVTRYTWDSAHQLLAVTPPIGTATSFGYDPLGRRVDVTSAAGRVHTVYNGTQPIATYDTSGGLTASFVYGAGVNEQLEETLPGGASYYYLHDALGSVTALTNSTGAVADSYRYTAFGQVHATGSAPNQFTYIGAPTDPSTGLVYLNARYLDPSIGRFISDDPIPSASLYAYSLDDPVTLADPTGREATLGEQAEEEDLEGATEVNGAGTSIRVLRLFRAVGDEEAKDLEKSGVYQLAKGQIGKYFYLSRQQAERLAERYVKMGLGGQRITAGRIAEDLLEKADAISPALEGPGFFVPADLLPYFTDVEFLL